MQEWMQDANSMQKMEAMMQEWGQSWDTQMNFQEPEQPKTLPFQINNPYMSQISETLIDSRDNL